MPLTCDEVRAKSLALRWVSVSLLIDLLPRVGSEASTTVTTSRGLKLARARGGAKAREPWGWLLQQWQQSPYRLVLAWRARGPEPAEPWGWASSAAASVTPPAGVPHVWCEWIKETLDGAVAGVVISTKIEEACVCWVGGQIGAKPAFLSFCVLTKRVKRFGFD